MQAKERQDKPLKWFVLPNESFKWDFILEKHIVEDSQLEIVPDSVGPKQLVDDRFDKDYIVTQKKRKRQDTYYY